LVGHYGGLGEIAQGFCRSSAVSGGVYILGKRILSIDQTPEPLSSPEPVWKESPSLRYMVKLDDFPHDLTCDLIIASRNHLPSHLRHIMKYIPPSDLPSHASSASVIARCIAIIDRPIPLSPDLNAPLLRAGQTSDQGSPLSAPLTGQDDTSVLIFPPSSLAAGSSMTSVNVLITGEGSKSTPQGKCMLSMNSRCRILISL
jgi:RAB protein geranylgeranyltransferase component A